MRILVCMCGCVGGKGCGVAVLSLDYTSVQCETMDWKLRNSVRHFPA